jgi:hypothetical protein
MDGGWAAAEISPRPARDPRTGGRRRPTPVRVRHGPRSATVDPVTPTVVTRDPDEDADSELDGDEDTFEGPIRSWSPDPRRRARGKIGR